VSISELLDEEKETKKPVKKGSTVCIGLDVGTMHLCCARSDQDDVNMMRNVFLKLDEDEVSISELSDINYVRGDDGELFIIGSDAFRFANIFGQQISRPMESGLISPKEIYALDVLTLMLKQLIGELRDVEAYCSYSVPAEAIDEGRSVIYHEKIFGQMLSTLGINHTSVNEAMAIVYSECAKEKFSGIGISFGAGMANCAISYKGIEALKFSTARAGDWIDKNSAESLGMVPNRVTTVKENKLDLTDPLASKEKNKKSKRVLQALYHYHDALINYTVKKIIHEFNETVDIEIDEAIPIVVSGGTSLPKGFIALFKDILNKYELPFEVSEIRPAKNPLTAVANGLLVKTMADIRGK
jgi:hypothetical protein